MFKHLTAIARSFYFIAGNNNLRVYECRTGRSKKLSLAITSVHFYVHGVMSIPVHEHFLCNSKTFTVVIDENFISVFNSQ